MKTEIFRIENDPITMKDWIFEHDNYTRIQVFTKYFSSRRYIFVVETQKFKIEAENKQEFQVLVTFHPFPFHLVHFHAEFLQS